jgi:hypothetical protein
VRDGTSRDRAGESCDVCTCFVMLPQRGWRTVQTWSWHQQHEGNVVFAWDGAARSLPLPLPLPLPLILASVLPSTLTHNMRRGLCLDGLGKLLEADGKDTLIVTAVDPDTFVGGDPLFGSRSQSSILDDQPLPFARCGQQPHPFPSPTPPPSGGCTRMAELLPYSTVPPAVRLTNLPIDVLFCPPSHLRFLLSCPRSPPR